MVVSWCGGVWSTTHATDKHLPLEINKTRVDDDEHDERRETREQGGKNDNEKKPSGRERQLLASLLCVFADLMQEAPTAPRSRALIGWLASSMTTHPTVGGQRHHIAKARNNKHNPRFACLFGAMRLLLLVRANSLCFTCVVLVGALVLWGGGVCLMHPSTLSTHPRICACPTQPKPQHDTRTHCTHTQPFALLVGDGPTSREPAPLAPAWPSHDCPAANAH